MWALNVRIAKVDKTPLEVAPLPRQIQQRSVSAAGRKRKDDVKAGTWVNVWGRGFVFSGDFIVGFATGGNFAIALNSVVGFQITGNHFNTFSVAIDYQTATCDGGLVSGNASHAVTSFEGATGNKGANVVNTGNATF